MDALSRFQQERMGKDTGSSVFAGFKSMLDVEEPKEIEMSEEALAAMNAMESFGMGSVRPSESKDDNSFGIVMDRKYDHEYGNDNMYDDDGDVVDHEQDPDLVFANRQMSVLHDKLEEEAREADQNGEQQEEINAYRRGDLIGAAEHSVVSIQVGSRRGVTAENKEDADDDNSLANEKTDDMDDDEDDDGEDDDDEDDDEDEDDEYAVNKLFDDQQHFFSNPEQQEERQRRLDEIKRKKKRRRRRRRRRQRRVNKGQDWVYSAHRNGKVCAWTLNGGLQDEFLVQIDQNQCYGSEGQLAKRLSFSSSSSSLSTMEISRMIFTQEDVREKAALLASKQGHIALWNFDTNLCVKLWQSEVSHIRDLDRVDADVFSVSDGYFKVHNIEYDWDIHSYSHCHCPLTSLAVQSPNLSFIGGWDGTVRQIDLRQKFVAHQFAMHPSIVSPVRSIALEPAVVPAKKIRKKTWKDEKRKRVPPRPKPHYMQVFVAHGEGKVMSYDMRKTNVAIESFHGNTAPVNQMSLLHGRLLTACDDGEIRIFDINSGYMLDSLIGHKAGVTCFDIAHNNIVSGSYDKRLLWYRIPTLEAAISEQLDQKAKSKESAYQAWKLARKKKRLAKKKARSRKRKKRLAKTRAPKSTFKIKTYKTPDYSGKNSTKKKKKRKAKQSKKKRSK